ncbi:Ku protein [Streptomyces atratus]|uniref:Ku protein n=1 Tax=Streptomyces TaxID=1883 RepID=UPI00378E34AA
MCRAPGKGDVPESGARGFAMPDGNVVPLTDEDLAHLPLPAKRVIEVLGFVPGQDIDPISYGKLYFAGPNGPGADRPYVLLVEALARTGFVGVSKIAIRSRERLALLRPRHGVLVVQTLLWADELREPGDLAPSAPVTDRELELAETLIGSLPGIEESELAAPSDPGRRISAYSLAVTPGSPGTRRTRPPPDVAQRRPSASIAAWTVSSSAAVRSTSSRPGSET